MTWPSGTERTERPQELRGALLGCEAPSRRTAPLGWAEPDELRALASTDSELVMADVLAQVSPTRDPAGFLAILGAALANRPRPAAKAAR